MQLRNTFTAGAAIAVLLGAGPAHAVMFDFTGGDADTPDQQAGTIFGEPRGTPTTPLKFSDSGVGLTVRGYDNAATGPTTWEALDRMEQSTIEDDQPDDPAVDGDGRGLGVITDTGDSSLEQINAEEGESMDLIFDTAVSMGAGLDFNSGNHADCPDPGEGPCGRFQLFVDGVDKGVYEALDSTDLGGVTGQRFTFLSLLEDRDDDSQDELSAFYVGGVEATNVPAPTTLALIGAGLLGLGAAARRRARA